MPLSLVQTSHLVVHKKLLTEFRTDDCGIGEQGVENKVILHLINQNFLILKKKLIIIFRI